MAPGSEGKVKSLKDLRGKRIIPRQETAGSRVLLAHLIEGEGLSEGMKGVTGFEKMAKGQTDASNPFAPQFLRRSRSSSSR